MTTLTEDQVAAVALQIWPGDPQTATVMTAIAFGESSFDTEAQGGGAKGLWQIQENAHPEFGATFYNSLWTNPAANGLAAKSVWEAAGKTYKPWVAYGGTQFNKNLPLAQQAVARVMTAPGGPASVYPLALPAGQAGTEVQIGGQVIPGGIATVPSGGIFTTPGDALDGIKGLFNGLGGALWIGGGAVLVLLGFVLLFKGDIAAVAKVAAL